jgi:hypothetical protein
LGFTGSSSSFFAAGAGLRGAKKEETGGLGLSLLSLGGDLSLLAEVDALEVLPLAESSSLTFFLSGEAADSICN